MDKSLEDISKLLSDIKFKKKIIGGLDPLDVWTKIEMINEEYMKIYDIQKEKYEYIIEMLKDKKDDE